MNRRRSNAQRKCWNFVGIFLVLLTRKVPEVLAIDRPNDYNGSQFFLSPNPVVRAHEFFNDDGRSTVYQDPIRYDFKIEGDVDIPWQKRVHSRALSEPFEGSPNGMGRASRKNSFRDGLGQRSMELDDESLENSIPNATDFSEDAFAGNPSLWKLTRTLRKGENGSTGNPDGDPDENDEDRKVRKECAAKIMQLEKFLHICEVAKAMHGILREVTRHNVLMKLLATFNIDRRGFKKFSFNSVLNKLTGDVKRSNNKMKKAVDAKKRKAQKRPKKPSRKPPRKKPTTPKPAVESEEDTTEVTV